MAAADGSENRPYYRDSLARVHHEGFAFHAEACAPGILALLEPLRANGGKVLELGCGTGVLTEFLVEAGHHVIATDASEAMLDFARSHAPGAEEYRNLSLPDSELPVADAIVSTGHVINYLADEASIERALVAVADAVAPGGLFALDVCDLEWGRARRSAPPYVRVEDDWAIVTRFSQPSEKLFVRDITTFVQAGDGTWSRDDERHVNVLVDASRLPSLLAPRGVDVTVQHAFGDETLLEGLRVLVGRKPAHRVN